MKYLVFLLITATAQAQQLPTGPIQIVKDKKTVNITLDSLNPLNNVFMPISVSSLPLPAGAATETTLSTLNGKIPLNLTVTSNKLLVDGSGVTQPVSATALPLPTGAATEAKQDTGNTSLSNINGKLNSLGQKAMTGSVPVVIASDQSAISVTGSISATNPSVSTNNTAIPTSSTLVGASDGTNLRPIKSDSSGELQIDVLSSALPTGAATESTLSTMNGKIPSNLTVSSTRLLVDGSGVTQPVSATSLPLPAGASTSSNQTNGSQKSQIVDGSGNVADVLVLSSNPTAANKGLITNTVIHGETTGGGGGFVDVKVTPSGSLATEASIASIADVDGQKTMALSFPVVIASDQSAIPISGSITASNASIGPNNTAIPTNSTLIGGSDGTNLRPIKTDTSGQMITVEAINTGGSFFTASISSAATITAPSNAVEVIIQASDTNTDNMRFVIGGTASASNGIELQPGRSETLKSGANISIAPVTGSQTYNIQYITR